MQVPFLNSLGTVAVSFIILFDTTLLGSRVLMRSWSKDAGANPLGVAVSNAASTVIGN